MYICYVHSPDFTGNDWLLVLVGPPCTNKCQAIQVVLGQLFQIVEPQCMTVIKSGPECSVATCTVHPVESMFLDCRISRFLHFIADHIPCTSSRLSHLWLKQIACDNKFAILLALLGDEMSYKQDRLPERFEFAKPFMSHTLCMAEEWFCGFDSILC